MEHVYTELVEKHGKSEYSIPLLQLWARAIATDNHDDKDEPSNWLQFKSQATVGPKRKRGETSLKDALTGATKVIIETVTSNHGSGQTSSSCISPAERRWTLG